MSKNVVLLAMSTLPMSTLPSRIREYRFNWDNEDNSNNSGYSYYSQLEPISRMIKEKEGSLDYVIILATGDTKKRGEYTIIEDGKEKKINTSAVEFYKERMKKTGVGLKDDQIVIVDMEEDNFLPAISRSIREIRTYWDKNQGPDRPKLWIDTQGGLRNINLVLNAVISLLKLDNIEPAGIYYVNFNQNNPIQSIAEQTRTYQIFQFVSGLNEFIRSGRAEQLTDYYEKIQGSIPEDVAKMRDIAEDIQMCDMDRFDQHLGEFREICRRKPDSAAEDELMKLFRDQIEKDYGPLLRDDCDGLDVVEWFYKKGFYQQAITYVESRMPQEWIKIGLITHEIEDSAIESYKSDNKLFQSGASLIVNGIVHACLDCRNWTAVCEENGHCHDLSDLKNGRRGWCRNTRRIRNNNNTINFRLGSHQDPEYDAYIHTDKLDEFMDLLLLYRMLKGERNKFNHMSKDEPRASKEKLGAVIKKLIETGRIVYGKIC